MLMSHFKSTQGHRLSTMAATLAVIAIGFTLSLPANAFRMLQNKQTGQVTVGELVTCDDAEGFAHWKNHTIAWRMNALSATFERTSRLQNALASWTAVTGSDYVLNYVGTTSGGFGIDGLNTVVFSEGNGCTGGCRALTSLVLQFGQEIVESDITMRPSIAWSIDGSTATDLEGTLAHEVGHSLGIHHSELADGPTMSTWFGGIGVVGRTLENDDQNAVRCSVARYGVDRPGTDITYRAHVRGKGWLQWVQNGATAGTTGESRRMEAAEIRIANGPGEMGVCYEAYIRGDGWSGLVCNGQTAGSTGKGRRMEGIRIYLTNFPTGCSLEYRAHVAGLGWMKWVSYNQLAGTTGQNRRMEALEVRLLGTCG